MSTVDTVNRRLVPALVLSVWTLLVWTTRIRNIWTDDDLSTAGQVGRTALSLSFTVLAVVTLVLVARRRETTSGLRQWVRAFALWTGGVWIVRATQIALADHEVAFVVVHTALALISIALAVWADRSLDQTSDTTAVEGGMR